LSVALQKFIEGCSLNRAGDGALSPSSAGPTHPMVSVPSSMIVSRLLAPIGVASAARGFVHAPVIQPPLSIFCLAFYETLKAFLIFFIAKSVTKFTYAKSVVLLPHCHIATLPHVATFFCHMWQPTLRHLPL